jgi:ATP-binding cassette subfamily C (CFTR/MRP) protein 1
METRMVSFDRVLKMTEIETECNLKPISIPINELSPIDPNWPTNSKVKFINFSNRYRPDTEIVLKNISMTIKSGEHVRKIN